MGLLACQPVSLSACQPAFYCRLMLFHTPTAVIQTIRYRCYPLLSLTLVWQSTLGICWNVARSGVFIHPSLLSLFCLYKVSSLPLNPPLFLSNYLIHSPLPTYSSFFPTTRSTFAALNTSAQNPDDWQLLWMMIGAAPYLPATFWSFLCVLYESLQCRQFVLQHLLTMCRFLQHTGRLEKHACMYAHTYKPMCVHGCWHALTNMHSHVHTQIHTHACTHAHACTPSQPSIHMLFRAIHTRIHIHTYTFTQAHAHITCRYCESW